MRNYAAHLLKKKKKKADKSCATGVKFCTTDFKMKIYAFNVTFVITLLPFKVSDRNFAPHCPGGSVGAQDLW